MAIHPCKECGGPVSDQAESCPRCGAKQAKKTSTVTWLILIMIILGALMAVYSSNRTPRSNNDDNNKVVSKESEDQKTANGLLIMAQMQIQNSAKDPSSVEFRNQIAYTDKKYGAVACGQYNAKNSFGGYIGFQGFVATEKDSMVFVQQVKNSKLFAERWNKLCVK